MRRGLVILAVLATAAAAVLAGAGGDDGARRFTVELDNAFGLVEGGDVKVAGVRAGKIAGLRIDGRSQRALVDVDIDRTGFGALRSDTFCETRPQSLIGEYFIDCLPGTKGRELPDGARIPIAQTASTVPPDLLADIMRRPYRERFRIILSQLGAGLAARGEKLNEAIRRASPGLRETNRVLAVLARQNRVLRDLVTDADAVVGDLAANRADVTRWVRETRETAAASARRRVEIAAGLRRLPAFLRELGPTMAQLGRAADAQSPALAELQASATQLETLFERLEPFSQSTRVNLRSLAAAAAEGRPAVKAARPVVSELERFSRDTPELANNLAIVLADLDDRKRAIEKDPRSPGGVGYTGLEALLQYVYDQALAINIFDVNGYQLKANIFTSECSDFQNAESLKEKMAEDPEFYARCASILGPNQLGILQPDPTKPAEAPAARDGRERAGRRGDRQRERERERPRDDAPRPEAPDAAKRPAPDAPIDLGETLEDLLEGRVPQMQLPTAPQVDTQSSQQLLDFLLGS